MTLPITVLTGFVGAGKTTLLKRALRTPELARALVIVNEVGEIPLDHLLVKEAKEDVLVLASGCVCCSVRGDLVETLIRERERTGGAPFDRVFVETTGLADPTPIVATLVRHPALEASFHLDAILTAIDAEQGEATLLRHDEAEKQVLLADDVIITKVDRVSEEKVDALRRTVSAMNAQARLHLAVNGDLSWKELLVWGARTLQARLEPVAPEDHQHHHGAVRTFMVRVEHAVDYRALALWLAMVSQLHGDRVLRVKGLVGSDADAGPTVIHAVQHVVYPAYTMARWPSEDVSSRVVVITRNMKEPLFSELCASLEETMARGAADGAGRAGLDSTAPRR